MNVEKILMELPNGKYGRFLSDRVIKNEKGIFFYGYVNAQNGSYCNEEVFLSSDLTNGSYELFQRGRGGEQGNKRGEIKSLNLIKEKLVEELIRLEVIKGDD